MYYEAKIKRFKYITLRSVRLCVILVSMATTAGGSSFSSSFSSFSSQAADATTAAAVTTITAAAADADQPLKKGHCDLLQCPIHIYTAIVTVLLRLFVSIG